MNDVCLNQKKRRGGFSKVLIYENDNEQFSSTSNKTEVEPGEAEIQIESSKTFYYVSVWNVIPKMESSNIH